MARNDGNSVDLDVETTEMAKNSTMFNAPNRSAQKDSACSKASLTLRAKHHKD